MPGLQLLPFLSYLGGRGASVKLPPTQIRVNGRNLLCMMKVFLLRPPYIIIMLTQYSSSSVRSKNLARYLASQLENIFFDQGKNIKNIYFFKFFFGKLDSYRRERNSSQWEHQ